jgi:hypothetical protein
VWNSRIFIIIIIIIIIIIAFTYTSAQGITLNIKLTLLLNDYYVYSSALDQGLSTHGPHVALQGVLCGRSAFLTILCHHYDHK